MSLGVWPFLTTSGMIQDKIKASTTAMGVEWDAKALLKARSVVVGRGCGVPAKVERQGVCRISRRCRAEPLSPSNHPPPPPNFLTVSRDLPPQITAPAKFPTLSH